MKLLLEIKMLVQSLSTDNSKAIIDENKALKKKINELSKMKAKLEVKLKDKKIGA